MAKCVACGNGGAKADLADRRKVCENCWFQAGFRRYDPGFGSGYATCDLNTIQFKQKLDVEHSKLQFVESNMKECYSLGSFGFVGFNDEQKLIMFKKHHPDDDRIYLYDSYSYDQLEDFDIVQKGSMSSSSSGGVGRAIVGGLLFGAAGAIVGAATSKQNITVSKDQNIVLLIRYQDELKSIALPGKQELLFKLRDIFEAKRPSQIDETPKQASHLDEADAILKFKELLDAGVITEEEFKAKKAQILGL